MSDVERYRALRLWTPMYEPLGFLAGSEVATMVLASDYDAIKAERDEACDLYAAISDNAAMYLDEIERLRKALVIAERHLALIAETGRATEACKDAAKFARAALSADSPADSSSATLPQGKP